MRTAIFVVLVVGVAAAWLAIPGAILPGGTKDGTLDPQAARARHAALARAKVFAAGRVNIAATDFRARRGDATLPPDEIRCRFLDTPVSGTTAKFDCTVDDGEEIRVKYDRDGEIQGEVAATHLLDALDFGADDVSMVRRVRCYGCPRWPFLARQISERLHLARFVPERIDYTGHTDFEWVSVERGRARNELKFGTVKGWRWSELSQIDPSIGGASRAEVDALRLMAMFLNHWDNKASNQRLVCSSGAPGPADAASEGVPECDRPLVMIQDAGSTFGPKKASLRAWSRAPFWADAATCAISMNELPYDGGTFPDVRISEEGRRLLGDRLVQLSATQIRTLFAAARFDNVDDWVAAFQRRVDAIARRPPCPPPA